eukprot:g6097.t1
MASLTTNQPPTKRQRTTNESTLEALQQERAPPPIEIGILLLPAGFEKAFGCDDFERVRDEALSLDYKGRRSIDEMILSHSARRLYLFIERYKREFPRGTSTWHRDAIPTPIVCACERGRMDDVELFMNLHTYHKDDMTLKDMVSQVGKASDGYECTPLIAAARNEHFHVVKYLIEQGEADPNIANSDGWNALHYAACHNRTNT